MAYYTKGNNSKTWGNIKAEFDIFAPLKKHKVNGRFTKAHEREPVNDIKQNIASDRTKDNIFLKPKDDRTPYGERVMTV